MTLVAFLTIILVFVFLIGLCIGSFLNVVISRAFSNESIVFPRSKCPSCQKSLKWYHNIPVFSYLFLKGKCAFCQKKISAQYPIVELVTGISFVAVFIKFGLDLNALFILIFVSLFVVIAATDIKERVVFDFHTYLLVLFGLIYNFLNVGHLYLGEKVVTLGKFSFEISNSFIAAVLGILLGIIVMEAFARFGYLVAGTRAFGEGDTYIAASLGSIFGWKYLILVLIYAFIIQIILTLPVFIKRLYENKDYRTLGAFFAFFLVAFAIKWFEYAHIFNNIIVFNILILLLFGTGFYVLKRILSGIKSKKNLIYLPFGPAMVLGGLIMIFLI